MSENVLRELAQIDLKALPDGNRLFMQYVGSPSQGVPPFLPPLGSTVPSRSSPPSSLRKLDQAESVLWQHVMDEIIATNERLGASRTILSKLSLAASRRARFIVTGQQPGALGGPLYVAYKIATAVALADRLERALGEPCIPLYWCGSDDADFQEIRNVHVVTAELSLVTSSLAQAAHATGMPVGDIEIPWLVTVWQNIRHHAGTLPGGGRVSDMLDRALARSRDHGELAAAILVELFGGRFAVVDGRSGAVRRYAKPVFVGYIAGEDAVKKQVTEAGIALETAGFHAQLTVGSDSGVFVVEQGRRRSVAADQRQLLVDAVSREVERCSPGVMARNLIQDYTFEPLAVVCGAAEIAYRAQMGGLYARFDVSRPAEFPRMTATFVPRLLAELVGSAKDMDARRLIAEPSGFAAEAYRSQIPRALVKSGTEFRQVAGGALDRLAESITVGLPDKFRAKMHGRVRELRGRMEELAESVSEAGRLRALERWSFLSEINHLIKPADKPQERRVASLTPFLHSPDDAGEDVIGLATRHVDELMDGRAKHIVYSTRS